MRRGVAELNGEGEVAGGVVILRSGENACETIEGGEGQARAAEARPAAGREIVTTYDRSQLIDRAVAISRKLVEEFIVVALVCALFLWHVRSALVAILAAGGRALLLPGDAAQGVNANIMSLGGIAIAIGAMVDAAVVMIENAHKRLEAFGARASGRGSRERSAGAIISELREVGPALFFSLLVITLSFVPVFALEAQEGRLFSPLAFTKTYAMAAARSSR